MDVSSYTAECGAKVVPGVKSKIYMVCACDIDTWPARKVTTGIGDTITLDGDIVLAVGKSFATIDIISESGMIKHTGVGSQTSKNFTNSFDFKTQKDIASDEWFDGHLNGCFIAIVVEKDGTMRVIGEPDMPARIEAAEGSGGGENSDEKSWIAQLLDKTGKVAPVYEGLIDLTV
jgi:hypothetical protein